MNILEELYYGSLRPFEKTFEHDSEYAKLVSTIAEYEETITKLLNSRPEAEEEAFLFFQIMNAQIELLAFSEMNRFVEGFQLGARFLLDSLVLPQQSVLRDIS
ncbi:MAG: hypothetical protein LBS36_08025 [Oscillospiraceae bacterium]|jgi:hypothetical protein|nr:hypothetical protein [Oscillospiraceae bacterium]